MTKNYIANGSMCHIGYFTLKTLLTIFALITAAIAYGNFNADVFTTILLCMISVVLLFIADMLVLPVECDNETITLHHVWRVSHANFAAIKHIAQDNSGFFSVAHNNTKLVLIITKRRACFITFSDDTNGIEEMLSLKTIH